jgi:hypothetical protein
MNPTEKAKELFKKMCIGKAKESALIAVNEIINSNPHSNPFTTIPFSTMDYWIDVKKEIQKL